MKLVEDVFVAGTPLQNKDLGTEQIVLIADDESDLNGAANLVDAIDAKRAPNRNKEEVTYKNGTSVVAYVPTAVEPNLAGLYGKRVNVLFGKDNEVALIVVTDEIVSNAYVTAWDEPNAEIEVEGTKYDVDEDVLVTIFGTPYSVDGDGEPDTDIDDLDTILTSLGLTNAKRTFDRNVVANIILNADDEVEKIDLMYSESNLTNGLVKVTEGIVESISSTGVIRFVKTNLFGTTKIEDIEDTDEPRVIKNGALVSLEDIEVGDVVTVVSVGGDYDMVYVSSNRVEGTISAIKNSNITIDGNVYYTITAPIGNTDGDIEKADSPVDLVDYFDEDVEAYINYFGEVSALVTSSDVLDATLGVVTRAGEIKTDSNDVDYISLRILTKDGSKGTYKIYNTNSKKSIDEEDDYGVTYDDGDLTVGKVVVFSADGDKKIKFDELMLVEADEEYEIDGKDLTAIEIDAEFNVNKDNQTLAFGGKTYRFNSSTVSYNTDLLEIISAGWKALVSADGNQTDEDGLAGDDSNEFTPGELIFVDGTRVRYYAGSIEDYQTTSNNYGVLADVYLSKDEDGDTVKIAKIFVDGEELEYEITASLTGIDEGDFITYTLDDDVIEEVGLMVAVADLEDKDLDAAVGATIDTETVITLAAAEGISSTTKKESLTVKEIDGDLVYYTDDEDLDELDELQLDKDGYIIYDLRDASWTMIDSIDDIVDLLVIGFASEDDVDILVVVE